MFPNAYNPAACGPLSSTLFHELSRFFLGPHRVGDGQRDPADRVYNCERACFGHLSVQTSQTCAACVGGKNGDARCKKFRFVPCENKPTPSYCGCPANKSRWYDDPSSCAVGCPTGLACFTARCEDSTAGPCKP